MRLRLGGMLDLSASDWPGRPCAVVFFAGCNFRCPFCHNSALIPMDSGLEVPLERVEGRLRSASLLVDAVHVTGGECTLQAEGLRGLCEVARRLGMDVGVNTNGSRPEVVKGLLDEDLISHVALDVKAPLNPDAYSRLIGVDASHVVDRVRETLRLCMSSRATLEVRTTVVPGMIGEGEVAEIAREVRGCDMYVLAQFVPSETVLSSELRSAPPTPRDLLLRLARVALEEGVERVYVRTREKGLERVG